MIKIEKVRFLALSLLSPVVISISLLASDFFSLNNINFLVFFIGLSIYIIMVSQIIIDFKKVGWVSKFFSVFISIIFVYSSFLGYQNTITVNGKNILFNSNEKKIYDLAIELRDELYIIQENQIFFSYPTPQVSTMSDLMIKAASQAANISKKRNPALNDKLPAQEFFLLFEKINKLSELQKNNLNNFINYSKEPTDAFKLEIDKINQDINLLILDSAEDLKALAKRYRFSLERASNE